MISIASAQDDLNDIRAERVITTSDLIVVDVYLNGKPVSDLSRQSLDNVYGAETEQDNIEVKKGDWLVFHVVYSMPRSKERFFAAAGIMGKGDLGFVSDPHSGDWSYCDDPSQVTEFIGDESYMKDDRAHDIPDDLVWGDGLAHLKGIVGDSYRGLPIWGKSSDHSVWLKFIVP